MAAKSKTETKYWRSVFNSIDTASIITILISIGIIILLGTVSPYTPNVLELIKGKGGPTQPELSEEDFTDRDKLIAAQNLDYSKTISLLKEPIATPLFYADAEKLKKYLISKSVPVKVRGTIENAYLYIKTGELDLERESVSFHLVDAIKINGHLFAPKSEYSRGDNEFVYNLRNLPYVKLPYSIKKDPQTTNVVDKIFNKNKLTNKTFYIGAFVSTTKLPNQVEQIEIRYSCVNQGDCEIQIAN